MSTSMILENCDHLTKIFDKILCFINEKKEKKLGHVGC